MVIRFLTDNKSLRKNFELSQIECAKKHEWRLLFLLCQDYFWLIQREFLKQVETGMLIWDDSAMHFSLN